MTALTPGRYTHSEEVIADQIRTLRSEGHQVVVKQLFTEREPCTVATCRVEIDTTMGKPEVYFWVDTTKDSPGFVNGAKLHHLPAGLWPLSLRTHPR